MRDGARRFQTRTEGDIGLSRLKLLELVGSRLEWREIGVPGMRRREHRVSRQGLRKLGFSRLQRGKLPLIQALTEEARRLQAWTEGARRLQLETV